MFLYRINEQSARTNALVAMLVCMEMSCESESSFSIDSLNCYICSFNFCVLLKSLVLYKSCIKCIFFIFIFYFLYCVSPYCRHERLHDVSWPAWSVQISPVHPEGLCQCKCKQNKLFQSSCCHESGKFICSIEYNNCESTVLLIYIWKDIGDLRAACCCSCYMKLPCIM